ncbi:MAG: HK97 family phage prohead protease [Aeromonas sp.]
MKTKHLLQFNAEIKALDGDAGEFEGYGSVFDVVDSYNEVVVKGAFSKTLKEKMPALLWQHRASEPIGVFTEAREDERGLYVKGQLNLEVQQGREAYALLKQGALSGLSIGFFTKSDHFDAQKGIRYLNEIKLLEVSLVTFPANEAATVDKVKSAPDTVRDFEKFLREAGDSQNDAKIIASHGFNVLVSHREGGDLSAFAAKLDVLAKTVRKSLPNGFGNNQ